MRSPLVQRTPSSPSVCSGTPQRPISTPTTRSRRRISAQLEDPRYAKVWPLARATELLKITRFLPNNPQFGDLNGIVFRALQGVETGRLSAKDAADFVIDEATASLKDVIVK